MTERQKIMKACLVCGAVVGMVMVTLPIPPLGSCSLLVSAMIGIGTALLSLVVMLFVVTVMFGKEWFGE